jgi:hypothetical protein
MTDSSTTSPIGSLRRALASPLTRSLVPLAVVLVLGGAFHQQGEPVSLLLVTSHRLFSDRLDFHCSAPHAFDGFEKQ